MNEGNHISNYTDIYFYLIPKLHFEFLQDNPHEQLPVQ